jgi:hypothetical protein
MAGHNDKNSGRPEPRVPQGTVPQTANGFQGGKSAQHSATMEGQRQQGRGIQCADRPAIVAQNADKRRSEKR